MKLFGITKSDITEDRKGENVPHLEITEVVLRIEILLTTIISKIPESCINLLLINYLINYQIFHPKLFLKTFDSEFYGLLIKKSKALQVDGKKNITLIIN